jgi:hypothetical protein
MVRSTLACAALVCSLWINNAHGANLRPEGQRELASYYHSISSETLGFPDPDAAIGNALKGLVESPIYTNPPYKADIPLAVEFYYLGRFAVNMFFRVA